MSALEMAMDVCSVLSARTISAWNDDAEKLFGYRADQVVERHPVEPGRREQQFQGGSAATGLQPGQGAHRDAGGGGELGQRHGALLAQGPQARPDRRQHLVRGRGVVRHPYVCHLGNDTCRPGK